MELPAMAQSLLGGEENEEKRYRPVVNLDTFFFDMYMYHNSNGLPAILLTQVCAICSLGFTVGFSAFLIAFVDWGKIMECRDEETCRELDYYVVQKYFASPTFFGFLTLGYCLLFSVFWVWRCFTAYQIIVHAVDMEKFYREKLGISLQELHTISWDEVVQRLIQLHDAKIYRVAINDRLTEHDVVSRIMRKENYLIALINKDLLDLRLPWWASLFYGTEKLFLTKSLEWSLYYCILHHIFNDQFNISKFFVKDVKGLQMRFLAVGVVHVLLLPYMLVFMTIHFFLQNASQFHTSGAYLGPRQWNPLVLWKFREFNELPHVFEARLNQSYEPANAYINSFKNPYVAVLARCVAYISGSFVAVLLLVSFVDDSILLFIHFGEHNLLWYLGICSAIFAAARSMIPDERKAQSASQQELMNKIVAATHLTDTDWEGKEHTIQVCDELKEMFPYKAHLFAMEVLSVVLTPIVLCFSLPKCAPDILEFIKTHSVYVDGVGAVCDYCLFDLERYGNDDFAVPQKGNLEIDAPQHGKLEQSYMNFQQAHPRWEGSATGKAMMSRLNAFRTNKQVLREAQMASVLQESISQLNRSVAFAATSPMRSPSEGLTQPDLQRNTSEDFESFFRRSVTQSTAPSSDLAKGLPQLLKSILKQENIDYENDFYWLTKFQREHRRNPTELERSIQSVSFRHDTNMDMTASSFMPFEGLTRLPSIDSTDGKDHEEV